jgi:hypothetical protein
VVRKDAMPGSAVFGQFVRGLELVDKSRLFELNLRKLYLRNSNTGEGKLSRTYYIFTVVMQHSMQENNTDL